MSLTNRVSLYFLATLAIVLCVYSMVFYLVTSSHVEAQFSSELHGVLNALVAAAEVEETEVKWQPLEHAINLNTRDEFGEVHWFVLGDDDLIVEQSRFDTRITSPDDFRAWIDVAELNTDVIQETTDGWAVIGKRMAAPRPDRSERELDEFDQLTIVAARLTAPRNGILFQLTLLVTLLPLLVWIIAALLGRLVVRKALRPVSDMAKQTQAFTGNEFQSRLQYRDSEDELSELGEAFNRLLERQQAAFEQQRRFAGDAAHELRTPLTVLLGQIDVTLRRKRSETEYEAGLESLRGQTQKLQEIVESLLFLARQNSDAATPTLRHMAIKPWLKEQVAAWASGIRSEDFQFNFELPDATAVRATPALLGRILDNLISNAMKYSAGGTPIVVTARQESDQLVIEVQDSGPGIDEEDLPRLFEPFFRSDDARKRGITGTGLGLAIASRIAKILEGRLHCRSESGTGACFELRLPLV